MGNCNFQTEKESVGPVGKLIIQPKAAISRNLFQFQYVIGRGGYGKVWKVEKKSSGLYYALKEMSKLQIIAKRSEQSVMNEKDILSRLHHKYAS